MIINTKNGFTIIELLLFLGVGGLLFVGILAGSGMAVSGQRYRDSVQSLQSVIQQQYSEVANVSNSRPDNLTCNSLGEVNESTSGTPSPRGTSGSCILMGRYIQSYNPGSGLSDGEALHIYPVIAASSSPLPSAIDDDTSAFMHYNLNLNDRAYELERVEWGNVARAKSAGASDSNQFSILILRSPLSGVIRTYTTLGSAINDPNAVLVDLFNMERELTLCVDTPGSNVFAGERMAIRLAPGASNQSGVEMLSQDQGNGC